MSGAASAWNAEDQQRGENHCAESRAGQGPRENHIAPGAPTIAGHPAWRRSAGRRWLVDLLWRSLAHAASV